MDAAGEVLTLEEAARRLKFTERTTRKMLQNGELRGKKVRGEWRIRPEALTELMKDESEVIA